MLFQPVQSAQGLCAPATVMAQREDVGKHRENASDDDTDCVPDDPKHTKDDQQYNDGRDQVYHGQYILVSPLQNYFAAAMVAGNLSPQLWQN